MIHCRQPKRIPEVSYAFPKTANGTCLMTDSPSPVSARQLEDLRLEVKAAVVKE
jgi:aspartyl-tRNA synthetase